MAGKLKDAHRRFIVTQLACFVSPTDVQKALREQFGMEITLPSLGHYDPNTAAGAKELAPKWRHLFEETRKRFSETLSDIPIAQQAWRLRQLAQQYKKLDERGNVVGAAAILEQAAKEVGGMFSNKRVLVGANDAPLIPDKPDRLTRDEQDEQALDIVERALARRAASVQN